jgi:hypothetical protein
MTQVEARRIYLGARKARAKGDPGMILRALALAVMVLGSGCVVDGIDEPRTEETQQSVLLCDGWLCGTNSPQIAEFGFWQLQMPPVLGTAGQPNNVGLQILAFVMEPPITLYLPKVHAGKLTAIRTQSDGTTVTLSGAALKNGWLWLRNGGRNFKITIRDVGTVESWAQPTSGPKVMLESYKLDWSELTVGWGDARSLCPHPPGREGGDALTMTGQHVFHTLLFEGDQIEPIQKLVTGVDNSWFNLGCAGSALAKMALTGHTQAARHASTFDTTLPERQAMLRMLAGAYCKDGTPFTVPGQPLNWRDDRNTMKLTSLLAFPPPLLVLEARWTDQGAACLNKPRIDAHWTPLGNATFGANVYAQVQAHCGPQMPPLCADLSTSTAGHHLLSATVPFHP